MRRLSLIAALFGLCISPLFCSAQNAPSRVCVAGMQVHGGSGSDSRARDLLMKSLKEEKSHPMEKVEVPMSAPADALAYAKEKNCDYLVTTNQTEGHTDKSMEAIGGMYTTNKETYYVTVAYQLVKVGDGSEVSSGSIKASDGSSEQNATNDAMKKIAGKVSDALKKAKPAGK